MFSLIINVEGVGDSCRLTDRCANKKLHFLLTFETHIKLQSRSTMHDSSSITGQAAGFYVDLIYGAHSVCFNADCPSRIVKEQGY